MMSASASGSVSRHCRLARDTWPIRVPYSPRVSSSMSGRCVATSPWVVLVTSVASSLCFIAAWSLGRSVTSNALGVYMRASSGFLCLIPFRLPHLDFFEEGAMSTTSNRHAGTGAGGAQATIPEPTYAERARTLLHLGRVGSLSTLSRKRPGFPFGSLMPYALDGAGRPLFLISTMAMHTQNLQQDARASLLVTQPEADGDPLGAARVTVVGNAATLAAPEIADARALYLERHPNSKYWVDFDDFSFFRMDVVDVYYVGGFGVMGWVADSDYERAQPDPLADATGEIIQHMNADHKDALILLARVFARIESQEATMTAVDRLGFHARLKTQDGMRGARIAFLREVSNPAETRKVLVEMVQQARSEV